MNPDKNDVVILELDRPRELKFSMKVIKEYSALAGVTMQGLDESFFDFDNQGKAAYVLLKYDSIRCGERVLTPEEVENLLDKHVKPGELFIKLNMALEAAFRTEEPDGTVSEENASDPTMAAGTGPEA